MKEHEKDLDKLISELNTVTEKLNVTGELGGKLGKIEEKLDSLEKEVSNSIKRLALNHLKNLQFKTDDVKTLFSTLENGAQTSVNNLGVCRI